jgi:large repetitive protein
MLRCHNSIHTYSFMRYLILLWAVLCVSAVSAQSFGRYYPARQRGWSSLSIDGGWAYQKSDVRRTFDGWGVGGTLGRNVIYRPGGWLAFDFRMRGLFARTYGRDWQSSGNISGVPAYNGTYKPELNYARDKSAPFDSSFVFANYRTGMGELSFEGVLTFNRLREQTGIVLSLYGGIGGSLFRGRMDQLDDSDFTYNYLIINRSNGRTAIEEQLDILRDGVYESRLPGLTSSVLSAQIMPAAGVELGFQITPRFVMGIGHKITFTRTDVFDGREFDDDGEALFANDWQNYTQLFMRWDLVERQRRNRPPDIEIIDPGSNPYMANTGSLFVKARIRNVNSADEVRYFVNGVSTFFNFRNNTLGASTNLRPGRNEIRIEAFNTAGRDEATLIVIWDDTRRTPTQPPVPPPPPPTNEVRRPEVRITTPDRSPFTTDRSDIYLRSEVRYVADRRNIRVIVNGTSLDRFTFAEGVEANVNLREGRNTIRVEAQNGAGTASDEVIVEYRPRVAPPPPPPPPANVPKPVVSITRPDRPSASVSEREYDFRATVTNVATKSDITLALNGNPVREFDFNSRNGEVSARLELRPNENNVLIRATNRSGSAEDAATIRREGGIIAPPPPPPPPPPVPVKPEITINTPANNARFSVNETDWLATTKNVTDKSEITVIVNGATLSTYDFNRRTQQVSGRLTLREGSNTLTVRVSNRGGSQEASHNFTYTAPVVKKPPTVTITAPADRARLSEEKVDLTAPVTNIFSKDQVKVTLNGAPVNDFSLDRGGVVRAGLILASGKNTIVVKVTNPDGQAEATSVVAYTPTVVKPTVTFTQPNKRGSEKVSKNSYTFKAKVTGIDAAAQVTATVNNVSIKNVRYNARGQEVSFDATLKSGENTAVVTATNGAGTANAQAKVIYELAQAPVSKPEISNLVASQPITNIYEPNVAKSNVKASIKNVNSREKITLKVNGTTISDFTFDATSGALQALVNLKRGENKIEVTATNTGGTETQSINVTW